MRYPLRLKLGALAAVCCFIVAVAIVVLLIWDQVDLKRIAGSDAARSPYWPGRGMPLTLYGLLLASVLGLGAATLAIVGFLFQRARDNESSRLMQEVLSRELEATARRAESASHAKSDFLATVSHEIRTPLNGVIGMSALLAEYQGDPQSRRYARTIHESAEILLSLINDILDFSKIEAGRLELERETFDLRDNVDSAITLFLPRLEGAAITLEHEVGADLPRRLIGDPGRLRQVLLNLLSNALKFTTEGQVVLRVARGELGRVRFEISDTGCGIPQSQHAGLFEPFRQGDASTARRFGGSGLGLAICKRLVTAMGGTIRFYSREDEGSRFWFELPLETAPPATQRHASPRAFADGERHIGGERLLVAEDNHINQQVAVAMLERFGYRVDVATSGNEAVTMAQAVRYGLIFMDVQMPGMDGLEATRRIRALGGYLAEVPIVAMTASAYDGAQARGEAAGMNGYLTKPILPDSLGAALANHLASASATGAGVGSIRSAPADDQALIDRELMEELESSLGPAMLGDLTALYRRQVGERLMWLSTAQRNADTAELVIQAHLLKGESSGLGFKAVAALADELERHAQQMQSAEHAQLIKTLQRMVEDSLAEQG
nr:ATP-binding protein [uncultured Halomonas sp.]